MGWKETKEVSCGSTRRVSGEVSGERRDSAVCWCKEASAAGSGDVWNLLRAPRRRASNSEWALVSQEGPGTDAGTGRMRRHTGREL